MELGGYPPAPAAGKISIPTWKDELYLIPCEASPSMDLHETIF
jgi:hypothetical protein